MKIELKPILSCTATEYTTEIEPMINNLKEIDLCPYRNSKRNTTWDCDNLCVDGVCDNCPFCQANLKILEAIQILKTMEIKK